MLTLVQRITMLYIVPLVYILSKLFSVHSIFVDICGKHFSVCSVFIDIRGRLFSVCSVFIDIRGQLFSIQSVFVCILVKLFLVRSMQADIRAKLLHTHTQFFYAQYICFFIYAVHFLNTSGTLYSIVIRCTKVSVRSIGYDHSIFIYIRCAFVVYAIQLSIYIRINPTFMHSSLVRLSLQQYTFLYKLQKR